MVRFDSAEFSGGRVCFANAKFSGGTVNFDRAGSPAAWSASGPSSPAARSIRQRHVLRRHGPFHDAEFSGGTVDFDGAVFSGGTGRLRRAVFSGGTFNFDHAVFSGGAVDFAGAGDWSVPPAFPWTDTPPPGVKLPRQEDQPEAYSDEPPPF